MTQDLPDAWRSLRSTGSLLFGASAVGAETIKGVASLTVTIAGLAAWRPSCRAAMPDRVLALRDAQQ